MLIMERIELEVTAELVKRTQSEYFDQSPFVLELTVTRGQGDINDNHQIDESTFRNGIGHRALGWIIVDNI